MSFEHGLFPSPHIIIDRSKKNNCFLSLAAWLYSIQTSFFEEYFASSGHLRYRGGDGDAVFGCGSAAFCNNFDTSACKVFVT